MPITEATITGCVSRTQARKSDGKTFTIYEVVLNGDANTKYVTFNRAVANEANKRLNMPAEVSFHTETSGMFENHYLDDVRDAEGAHQQRNRDPVLPSQAQPPQAHTDAPIPQQAGSERDYSIWRQVAAKVSAELSSSPGEFWSNVDDLVSYFQTGAKPERFSRYVPPEARDMSQAPQNGGANQFVPEEAYAQPDGTARGAYTDMEDPSIPF